MDHRTITLSEQEIAGLSRMYDGDGHASQSWDTTFVVRRSRKDGKPGRTRQPGKAITARVISGLFDKGLVHRSPRQGVWFHECDISRAGREWIEDYRAKATS